MLEREELRQVRSVIKDVLREGQLDKLPDLFGREHHKHRGTHDLTFKQIVDAPDYIDNRQFLTIVNEDEDGIAFVDLLGADHQIAVTKNPHDITLGLHHQVHVYSDEEAPRVRISNLSDTLELDPVLQFGLGADDTVKFTQGVDDSDSDAWLLCSGDVLSSAVTAEEYGLSISYDGTLLVTDTSNDRIKRHLSSDAMTYVSKVGSAGSGDDQFNLPWGICTDGWYVYVLDSSNHRVVKRLLSNLSYVAQVGSHGAGDDQFSTPRGMCTDGAHLYIADGGNDRIVKRLCSDLSFVAKTNGSEGLNGPRSICTDGHYLYLIRYAGATYIRWKFLCSTLALVQRELTDGQDVHTWAGMCHAGGFIYACMTASIHKYTSGLVYVSEWGSAGTGDGQFTSAEGITTDGTHLWITDMGGLGGSQRIQKFLLDGTFVAKYGTYGDGDTQFFSVRGICLSGTILDVSYIPYRAPILKAGLDGSYVDAYPLLRARDGFQLMEDGTVGATDYVGLYAPAAITASYSLTFPGTGPAAVGHLAVSAAGLLSFGQNVGTTGSPTFVKLTSLSVAIGTAPITVTSTTVCANLNAGMVDGYHHDQSLLTTVGPSFDHVHLTVANGAAPLVVTSTTKVDNLNVDYLDGLHSTSFAAAVHYHDSDYISIIASPAANHFPYQTAGGELIDSAYDAADFAAAAHSHALDDLSDVTAPAPSDTNVLSWNAATSKWIPAAAAGGYVTFLSLTDTPADYVGSGGYFVKVNAGASALEFVASSVAGHDILSASHGDALASAVSRGSIIYGNATPKWAELAVGAAGYVLTSDGTDVAWVVLPAAGPHALLSSTHSDTLADTVVRGDLMIGNSTPKWERLAKGTSGYILTMGANDPAWTAPPAVNPLTTVKGSAQVTSADSAVWVDITGLVFTLVSGRRYYFKFIFAWQSQGATRGIHLAFPSSPAMTYAHMKTTVRYAAVGTDAFYENEATALTTDLASVQLPAINTDYWACIEGYCTPSANGDIQLKFHTEYTTNTVTVQNGGVGMLIDLG